jgi:hypothetical protein
MADNENNIPIDNMRKRGSDKEMKIRPRPEFEAVKGGEDVEGFGGSTARPT